MKEYAISNGILSDKILVTKEVGITAEESVAIKETISRGKRIILITYPSVQVHVL